jgi:hypothetical protein
LSVAVGTPSSLSMMVVVAVPSTTEPPLGATVMVAV